MQALSEKETRLLIQGGAQITGVTLTRTKYKRKDYFQISFTLKARDIEKEAILITVRNEPHRWVDLTRAVTHVEKIFPEVTEVKVVLK